MTEDIRGANNRKDLSRKDSVPSEPQTSHRERMDLDTARKILTAVVGTHEGSLTEESDLSKVGTYDLAHVREAFIRVADDIADTRNGRNIGPTIRKSEKNTQSGRLVLQTFYQVDDKQESSGPESLSLSFAEHGSSEFVIESQIPMGDDVSDLMRRETKFKDVRNGELAISDLEDEFTIEKYRNIWKGVRWMSANMLSWNENFLRPEDIETLFLSSTEQG